MDDKPLDELIRLLQTKTMINDSYARELSSYSSVYKSLKLEPKEEELTEGKKLLVGTMQMCDKVDTLLQQCIEQLQNLLDVRVNPKNGDHPG